VGKIVIMARTDASAGPAGYASVERFFQFSLLGLVASGYLAVAGSGYLDTPTLALTGAGLILRALLIAGIWRFRISDSAARLIALSYVAFFGIDYTFLSRDFLSATVHLVFFLAVTKILTARTNRDYLFTAAIAFLELVAAAILSAELNFILFLALYLVFAIGALTSGEIRGSLDRSQATAHGWRGGFHPRLAVLATLATIGILALTGGLFFLLPRTAEAAFARLVSRRIYLPGFSDQVTFGDIGEIKTTSRVVMHVGVFSQQMVPGLKWRGAALTQFDGKRWSNPDPREERIPVLNGHVELQSPGEGRRLNYHVQFNSVDTDALFFAGTPVRLDLPQFLVIRNDTGSYRLARTPPAGFSYDAYSLLEDPPETASLLAGDVVLPADMRREALGLPRLDPRVSALAQALTAGATTDLERARALERHLRHDYAYSLELPGHAVADPLADFLFTRRKGYCEHFATAMTVMLRTLNIPARLATGFESGIYNSISDLWVVRASDAHTWVEAWIPEHGWVTFDPTPAAPNQAFTLLSDLGLYVDAAQTFWQDWVVSYDLRRQGTLSYRMERAARLVGIRWSDSIAGLGAAWPSQGVLWLRQAGLGAVILLAGVVLAWLLVPRLVRQVRVWSGVRRVRSGRPDTNDATLLYQRMLHLLERRGYQKPAWFTPVEFAASLPLSGLGTAVGEFTATYNRWRFGGQAEQAANLSRLLDNLERRPSK
jgi:transglutaminase-like putative cysteine protease